MRSTIGVNDDCLWLCGDLWHSHPSLSALAGAMAEGGSSGGGSQHTGTGVGSNLRFVCELEVETRHHRKARMFSAHFIGYFRHATADALLAFIDAFMYHDCFRSAYAGTGLGLRR